MAKIKQKKGRPTLFGHVYVVYIIAYLCGLGFPNESPEKTPQTKNELCGGFLGCQLRMQAALAIAICDGMWCTKVPPKTRLFVYEKCDAPSIAESLARTTS